MNRGRRGWFERRREVYPRPVLVAALMFVLASLAGPGRASDQVLQFSTPSKNIGCVYARFAATPNASALPATLRCDIRTGLKPKPPKPRGCNLDWGDSYELRKKGRVDVTCHGDTALGSNHILAYGTTWRHDGFTCTSQRSGLTCRNLSGHGFFMSRGRSRSF